MRVTQVETERAWHLLGTVRPSVWLGLEAVQARKREAREARS